MDVNELAVRMAAMEHPWDFFTAVRWDDPAWLRRLLANPHGVDLDARDADGWTALHWAAGNTNPSCLDLLLEEGASIDARDANGCTPLCYASLRCANRLILKGADVRNTDNAGDTPFSHPLDSCVLDDGGALEPDVTSARDRGGQRTLKIRLRVSADAETGDARRRDDDAA